MGNDTAFADARAQIDAALEGFRAAPLSEEELARRAGQLMRFLSLVPVEYERGVRNGVITSDIEIQEALTFHAGALAAFNDLQAALAERDPQAAARVEDLFAASLAQIRDVAEPGALRSTLDEATQLLTAALPAEWLQNSAGSDIDVILSVLDQVAVAAAQGEYTQAESARLEAYALLELGVEQRLRGFVPDMAVRIESLFWQGTNEHTGLSVLLASQASSGEIRATLAELEIALGEVRLVLDSARSAPTAVAGNAAVIVFREGLEAVLILASLLASLRAAEERRFRRPLIMGALLALGASVVTWWLANHLLTLLLPLGERLEAIVSLIAIAVLLVITNWFFHHVYWTGWM
ncbi:MAG: iron permease, partial [Candidatus Acidiferrales bacterium]